MTDDFFTDVTGPIPFGGLDSTDPLAFKVYQPDRLVLGKRMEDHLRIGVCLWHSFAWPGSDMFGVGHLRPAVARRAPDPMIAARAKLAAAFEFLEKLGVPYYCFHDRDVAPEGATFAETQPTSTRSSTMPPAHMARTGVRLLWGTANLFSHPRYAAGAATNPDPEVFAYAAAQVKHDARGHAAPRRRELRAVGRPRGLRDAAQHRPGARGAISSPASCTWSPSTSTRSASRARCSSSPSRMEPTKHQYDYDAATVYGFLRPPRPRAASTGSTSRPTTPRWPGTASITRSPTRSPTASSAASTPTAATPRTAGTPTSSRTRSTSCRWRCTRSCARGGFTHRRLQLRRQAAPPEHRPRATCSTPTSAGIDTLARALLVAADMIETGDPRAAARGALRRLGGRARASDPRRAARRSRSLADAGRRRGDRPTPGVRPPGAAREHRQPADLGRGPARPRRGRHRALIAVASSSASTSRRRRPRPS